jgi:lipoate-protein ligase A
MLWQNASSVILGKSQSAYAEVDLDYARAHGIRIVRRITGGGAVYHDEGNLNYTYISPATEGGTLDFAAFSKPIVEALASLGVNAVLTGRNDLEVNGKKISGNAQYHRGGRTLHRCPGFAFCAAHKPPNR